MFSLSDITQLGPIASLYTGTPVGQRKNYNKFVATLTVNFGGEDRTFAIKITDYMQFMRYCTDYNNLSLKEKKKLGASLANKYLDVQESTNNDTDQYVTALLIFLKKQNFNGVSIYQADSNFSGWSKLSIDPVSNTLTSNSCN